MITNAAAGTAEVESVDAAVGTLAESRTVQVQATSELSDLERVFAERASRDVGPSTVVVIGGDGSLHAVVACLYARGELGDVTLGLVPLGTGNDFARTIALASDPAAAARQVLAGTATPIDLIVDDEDHIVINAVHLGLGAEAGVAAKPLKKYLGPVGYAIGAVISGFTKPGKKVAVRIDGELVKPRGKVLQVAVGNGRYVGGGAPLLPEADPSDELLDIAVSYADPRLRRLTYAISLRFGVQAKRDDVVYRRGRKVEVSGESFRCNADGEISGHMTERTWRIEPGAVTMLLPSKD